MRSRIVHRDEKGSHDFVDGGDFTIGRSGRRGTPVRPLRMVHASAQSVRMTIAWSHFHDMMIWSCPTKEPGAMSIESHLAELERRHAALEDQIKEAMAHPSSDSLEIADMKRRKLQLKDEINRLRGDATLH
jgi:hypothetical protein